jgi:hypothetical protein
MDGDNAQRWHSRLVTGEFGGGKGSGGKVGENWRERKTEKRIEEKEEKSWRI